jgi:YesN/AraC family two-component response regulator
MQRFELIWSDIRMPNVDGSGLNQALSEAYPEYATAADIPAANEFSDRPLSV